MNAVGMLVQPNQVGNGASPMESTKKLKEATPVFSMLLKQHGQVNTQGNITGDGKKTENTAVNILELLSNMDSDVQKLLEGNEDLASILASPSKIPTNENLEQLILSILQGNSSQTEMLPKEFLEKIMGAVNEATPISVLIDGMSKQEDSPVQLVQSEIAKLGEQLIAILAQFDNLLSGVKNEQDVKKIAPKVLELLQQWTAVESKIAGAQDSQNKEPVPMNVKVSNAWKEIFQAYQNRSKLTAKQHYQNDSQVTTKDVVKWIENALKNQQEKTATAGSVSFHTNAEMPKLEQYVIFINQNQGGQSVDQQLIDQFQQVLKTSKFLTMPNGTNQLSISLRPENLGEMMVRLTEVNGEMTVKIVVTTQAAKDMLESNIHQLKHMFSPQQVVIERQDMNGSGAQNQTKENTDQSYQNQGQGHSEQQHQQERNSKKGDEFGAQLSELIHEKV